MPKILTISLLFELPDDYTAEKYPEIAEKIAFIEEGGGVCGATHENDWTCSIGHSSGTVWYPDEESYLKYS